MAAVAGYAITAAIAVAVICFVAGHQSKGRRDHSFDLPVVTGRQMSVLGGLAGFSVTGLVLLVTLSRNAPAATGTTFTTVLTMFVVSYMGYYSASLMFASISDRDEVIGFDLPATQYAGAAIQLYFTLFVGWFALRPLFETFHLATMAQVTGWLLVGAVFAGYALLITPVYRTGHATGRVAFLMLALGIAGTGGYALLSFLAPGLRSDVSTLALTVFSFVPGALAFIAVTLLPVIVGNSRIQRVLEAKGHLFVLSYAQAVIVLLGFMLLSVLGLA